MFYGYTKGQNAILRFSATFALSALLICCGQTGGLESSSQIEGKVTSATGPVSGAIVRIQTTERFVLSDSEGHFTINGLDASEGVSLSAWAEGFYIGGGEKALPGDNVEIELHALPAEDNANYTFTSSYKKNDSKKACEVCHTSPTPETELFPFDQWAQDAHSKSAVNERFLSMYSGEDLLGNKSPATRYGKLKDYPKMPLPPDLTQPYYGPGFRLDFPNNAGNCAACHLPVASINHAFEVDPRTATGVEKEGVSCDFCHKVWDAKLEKTTGLPAAGMPGVLSYEYRRPPAGKQFFAGPLDDVAPGDDTYREVYKKGQFCAPCHTAKFWDVQIYDSFGEWLASPYSDEKSGLTCQDCHMAPKGATQFTIGKEGGRKRPTRSVNNHLMRGPNDSAFLKATMEMDAKSSLTDGKLSVEVKLTNVFAGHHMPTGSPLRHMILLVEAKDENGNLLKQSEGSVVPKFGGEGDASKGYYSGLPGKIYAKVLQEWWTGTTPTASYWNRTRILSDNRIPALESDSSSYQFLAPKIDAARVEVRLVYRRAFIQLANWKKWELPDLPMLKKTLEVSAQNN
jgi:hypothetical protein